MSNTTSSSSAKSSRFMDKFKAMLLFVPFLGYHRVVMTFIVISVVLQCVLVTGCTMDSLSGVYLFSLQYKDRSTPYEPDPAQANTNGSGVFESILEDGTSTLRVHAHYFGVCITSGTGWICSSSSARLAAIIKESDTYELSDPFNLVLAADKFKSDVIFVGLFFISIPFAAITFILMATFPGWHEEVDSNGEEHDVKPFPSKSVMHAALACALISALMALLGSFWQHMASVAASTMLEVFTYDLTSGGVGAGAMVLGWLSSLFLIVVTVGLLLMIVSIRVLSEVTG